MLCKNCGLRPATTHIKRVINGRVEEYHLCADCANKLNVSAFDPFDLSQLWGSFFGDRMPQSQALNQKSCPGCGQTFSQVAKLGKLGCPECYTAFYDDLLPSLRKIHGKTRHVGRVPHSADEGTKASYQITDLKKKLEEAIENENYEDAAKIRDEIKAIEANNQSEAKNDAGEDKGNE